MPFEVRRLEVAGVEREDDEVGLAPSHHSRPASASHLHAPRVSRARSRSPSTRRSSPSTTSLCDSTNGNRPQHEGVLGQLAHSFPVLPPPSGDREHVLDGGHASIVAQDAVHSKALLAETFSLFVLPGEVDCPAVGAECGCPKLGRDRRR